MGALRDAIAAQRQGDLPAAEALYLAALEAEPLKATHNLGVLYLHQGRLAEAETHLRRAMAMDPALPHPRFTLSKVLLAQGRYAEGWPLYEARREVAALRIPTGPPELPEWQGEPLSGRRLLVFGEQGFGDQIMFGRFIAPLAPNARYVCSPSLARLIPGSIPGAVGGALPTADVWTVAGSLPLRLGTTLETLPPPLPLSAPAGDARGVGVVTRGRPSHENDSHRSLPAEAAAALLALGTDISPEATGAADFLATAKLIAGLDLVISVDTAIAHLAASLGKPTWILLPAFNTDWRWLRERETSPWYPTARLFRQPRAGDWTAVIEAVETALAG